LATGRVSRGRKSQQIAADFLRPVFPEAEGIAASLPGRDILKTPDWAIEVKATKDFNPTAFMKQAMANGGDDWAFSIYRPKGYGEAKVSEWIALTTLGEMRGLIDHIQRLEARVAKLSDRTDS
jgi:hypothetical protein